MPAGRRLAEPALEQLRAARPSWRSLLAVLWTVGLVVGCGPAPAGDGELLSTPPPSSPAPAPVLTVTLPGQPAGEYRTDRRPEPGTTLSRHLAERFPQLRVDPCLELAAAAYGRTPRADDLPLAFSEFVLHWAGCPDPFAAVAHVLTDRDDDTDLMAYLEGTLESLDASHLGAARQAASPPYAWRWTVFLTNRRFELQPVPTSEPEGGSALLVLRFLDPVDSATVITTTADGRVEEHAVGLGGGHMVASVVLGDLPGTRWIEVVGDTRRGPTVVALFPIEVGGPPPCAWSGRRRADESWITDRVLAEDHALALLEEDRARFGLAPLAVDERLADVARRHSAEMASTGEVGHVTGASGSVVDRLAAAGYRALFAAENVARSSSIADAEDGLMRSPGHRAAVLSTRATHVGIGIVRRQQPDTGSVYYITQVFARPVP